jgi:hypothetical protein
MKWHLSLISLVRANILKLNSELRGHFQLNTKLIRFLNSWNCGLQITLQKETDEYEINKFEKKNIMNQKIKES